jgi:hypothetical protein
MGSGDCSGYGTQKSDSDQATDGLLITKERTTYYLTTLNNSFSVSTINTSSIFIIQGAASAANCSRINALLQKFQISLARFYLPFGFCNFFYMLAEGVC